MRHTTTEDLEASLGRLQARLAAAQQDADDRASDPERFYCDDCGALQQGRTRCMFCGHGIDDGGEDA